MNIIVGGRGSGKTHRLVEEALKHPDDSLILTTNAQQAERIDKQIQKALRLKGASEKEARLRAGRMVRPASAISHVTAGRRCHVYIDDLEYVLSILCHGNPVEYVAENALVETAQGKRFEPLVDNPHLSL